MDLVDFESLYETPFTVDGTNLDSVKSIQKFYSEKMLTCTNLNEMRETAKKFGFLTMGAEDVLDEIDERVRYAL